MKKLEAITFYEVGDIEVSPGRRGYRWVRGYSLSESGSMQPWRSRSQARIDARLWGGRAVFVMKGERDHDGHGAAGPDGAPDDCDCPCRDTGLQGECAAAGCGVCRAHEDRSCVGCARDRGHESWCEVGLQEALDDE